MYQTEIKTYISYSETLHLQRKMKFIFLISVYVIALSLNNVSEALKVVTMDSSKTQVNLDRTIWGSSSSGILKSHSYGRYPTGMNKTITFIAPYGSAIVASIRLLDLRPRCIDKVTLFNVTNGYGVMYCNTWGQNHKEDDRHETKTFYVPSGKLGVTFTTDRYGSTSFYDGFQLTYTVVNSAPCSSYEYRCSNHRCISNEIKCDGHNHCGDGSDGWNCGISFSKGRTVGIVIGSIFLVIGIIMAFIYGVRRCNSVSTTETIVTSHPPPAFPGNPPPPYTTSINNPSVYPTAAYPPPAYNTSYPQGYSNPNYR